MNRKGFSLTPKGVFTDHRWILGERVEKGWNRKGFSLTMRLVWFELTVVEFGVRTQIPTLGVYTVCHYSKITRLLHYYTKEQKKELELLNVS